ncbi:MAG: tetratricopeptide repeat protein [Gemmataceae bacterium]
MRTISVPSVCLAFLLPVGGLFAQTSWKGEDILIKREDVSFLDEATKKPKTVSSVSCRVLEEEGTRLRVSTLDGNGWIEKADAVLLKDAVPFFSKLIDAKPAEADFYNRRGVALKLQGDFDNAIKDFSEGIRLAPNSSGSWGNRGAVRLLQNDLTGAIRDLTESIRLSPTAFSLQARAECWRKAKEFDKAIADLTEAIKLRPADSMLFRSRGFVWGSLKNVDKSIDDYTEAIRLDPQDGLSLNARGFAWEDKKDFEKALADFEKALKLNPSSHLALSGRGRVLANLKRTEEAIADYTAYLRLRPISPLIFAARADLFVRLRDYPKAVADYEHAIDLERAPAHVAGLAWLLATCPDAKIRDGKRASKLASEALAKAGEPYWWYLEVCAAAAAESGNFTKAVILQEAVLAERAYTGGDAGRARLKLYKAGKAFHMD